MKTYMLVELDIREPEYEDDQVTPEDVSLKSKQFSLREMLTDPEFRRALIQEGWADTTMLQDLDTADAFGPRTFLLSCHRQAGYGELANGSVIDPKNVPQTFNGYSRAAHSATIAVEVSIDTLEKINPEAADLIRKTIAARKRAERSAAAAEEKRKLTAAEKKKQRDARKVEAAKKLLEDAGIKVGT